MGMGTPACFDPDRDLQSCASIGIDCHNATLASIPAEMRAALQHSRGIFNDRILKHGKKPARVYKTVEEAYALGTMAGARAIGMEHELGSITVGKLADIIVFDALTPNMLCGAQYDPITAIVLHSTPADIVMTIVDGVIRKRDSQLEPVQIIDTTYASADLGSRQNLKWSEIAERVLETRETLQSKIEKVNLKAAKPAVLKAFGYDQERIVEKI
ncbi:hypothetical protein RBB50_000871 [Rhinocladiella similis]